MRLFAVLLFLLSVDAPGGEGDPPGTVSLDLEAGVRDLAALSRVAGYVTSGTAILKPLESAARLVMAAEEPNP